LASNNISANQIRQEHEERLRAAREAAAQNGESNASNGNTPAAPVDEDAEMPSDSFADGDIAIPTARRRAARKSESTEQELKHKKNQANIDKIKASKKRKTGKKADSDSDFLDELLARSAPLPGQMENCEICDKRFTVTPYSRAGPNGGLVCNPCGKELDKENPLAKKKGRKPTGGASGKRRNIQSKILDGTYRIGAPSMMTMCVKVLVKNIELADDLGDIPPSAIDKIARNLSKNRMVDSRTLDLFLQPSAHDVYVYDGAKLSSHDIIRIFQRVPHLKNLKIRNAIQFKDEVMVYLLSRDIELESLYLSGANLLSTKMWNRFIVEKGAVLKSLRVYFTDRHFDDTTLALLGTHCPQLKRLKMRHVQAVTGAGVKEIANVKSLEHLGIQITHNRALPDVHPDVFVHVLDAIGAGLKTFSLTMVPTADNSVLSAIHHNCRALQKLRITDSEVMTDDGFVRLFSNWENPPLRFLDLSKCRHVDSTRPRENPDGVGLGSMGFRSLMRHSGQKLVHLNVHACRHITKQAFEEVFSVDQMYPELTSVEVSFCEEVDDFVVGSIFRSCPAVHTVNVFGCMKVRDARVPRGKILVGVPNAQGMQMEGEED
jgi:DNA repair protein RAD7